MIKRIRIQPEEKVPVSLSEAEIQLLLDKMIAPPDIEQLLRFRVVEDGNDIVRMDLDSIEGQLKRPPGTRAGDPT